MKKRLEGLAREVGDPAVRGRVNEIWARMMVVSEQARKMEESVGRVEIVWDQKQLETAGKVWGHSVLVDFWEGGMLMDVLDTASG